MPSEPLIVIKGTIGEGATVEDGISSLKTMIAIQKSIEEDNWIKLSSIDSGNL